MTINFKVIVFYFNVIKKILLEKIYQIIFTKVLVFLKIFHLLLVDDLFEILIEHLLKFNKIKISSFGTFEVINKKERIGRNPRTKVRS